MSKHSKGRYSSGTISKRKRSHGKHAIEKESKRIRERKETRKSTERIESRERIGNKEGRERKKRKKSKGIIKKIMFIIILVILLIFVMEEILVLMKNDIKEEDDNNSNNNNVTKDKEEIILPPEEVEEKEIPDKIGGYDVLGVIVIDKIGIEQNILNKTTDSSLSLAVTKFYGPQINEQGNFCIAGHNYKGLFIDLKDLQNGDTFYIIDKAQSRKITYQVYKKYSVEPTELDCLSQSTEGRKEVTLITCNPGGLTRLIIKAKEI